MSQAARQRCRLRVTGTVQGVGFRPFVYRHAVALGLSGFVRNDSAGVLIEVEGAPSSIAELRRLLVEDPPPLARVAAVVATHLALTANGQGPGDGRGVHEAHGPTVERPASRFVIASSGDKGLAEVPVSIDTGPCDHCLREVDDPTDRRYRYPFTNCTDCGPRYTIVVSVPYDRPATTMAGFSMCGPCRREYEDPADRRFHAQPNACLTCGPRVGLCDPRGRPLEGCDDPLAAAARLLRGGAIVGVKGVGGYHLAVDAADEAAVAQLRRRKARDDKPFAVMVPDLDSAARLVGLSHEAAELLCSPRRPIVLAPRLVGAPVASGVAPGLPDLGVMLPYSPLHHLLLAATARPLVMTSGNQSDEPIAHTDADALARLGSLVDAFVVHDRPIHIRCDDSVVRARPGPGAGRLQVIRRSRGYAPEPMVLVRPALQPLLAVGAELKCTISVAKDATVVASHHLGDLEHLATYQSFLQAVAHLSQLCGVEPALVVHDLHPEYLSTKYAVELGLPAEGVQHHHAHVASCLVDHRRDGPVLGVAFDGLGYGPDGTLWGGELLVADLEGFERIGHLAPVPLPGGAAAIREPWRMAVAWARQSVGEARASEIGARLDGRNDRLLELLGSGASPTTTSVGRLFDAVSAIVLGRATTTYEGQAAIELEACCAGIQPGRAGRYPVELRNDSAGMVLDPAPLVASVVDDVVRHRPGPQVAAAFHDGLASAVVDAAALAAAWRGLGVVALTGGVFQNVRLSGAVERGLAQRGLEVLVHRNVPANDGGISIGQAAVGAARSGRLGSGRFGGVSPA